MGALLPPVMGTLLEHRFGGKVRLRVYLSGDTLTGDHVSTVAERHSDIDVAVVHLGGTRVLLRTVTMDADQGVDFLRRGRPATAPGCRQRSPRSSAARPSRCPAGHMSIDCLR